MACWLIKSEPTDYAITDLMSDVRTNWTGVRNYQARNFLRDGFKVKDSCLFYHSSCDDVGVAGIAAVEKIGIPDETQFDKKSIYYDPKATKDAPIWYSPTIKFVKKFDNIISLSTLREQKSLQKMQLLQRGNRLSVMPVTEKEFETIIALNNL